MFAPRELNQDLQMDVGQLEKKRDETKLELKRLLKKYLTDHERAVFTAPPIRHAMAETD